MTLSFDAIVDTDARPISQEQTTEVWLQRGDAKADGYISIGDVLFIAQHLVGYRGVGLGPGLVHPVNAASVKHDGNGDKVSIADALLLAQFLVGLRDCSMDPVQPGTPPLR